MSSSLAAGAAGGTIAATLTCPLEVVKTRLQSSTGRQLLRSQVVSSSRLSVTGCLGAIYRTEGVRGLWRGLVPTLAGVTPSRAVYFYTYSKCKDFVSAEGGAEAGGALVPLACGAFAGCISATLVSPVWVVKTRVQLASDSGAARQGVLDCVRQMYRREGAMSFYRGLTASYWGVTEGAVQIMLYETLKQRARERAQVDQLPPQQLFFTAALAKFIASASTYPHEVVRTRLREQVVGSKQGAKYTGVLQALRVIAREEGAAGLYGGLASHLLRVVPNSAIMFLVVELLAGV